MKPEAMAGDMRAVDGAKNAAYPARDGEESMIQYNVCGIKILLYVLMLALRTIDPRISPRRKRSH